MMDNGRQHGRSWPEPSRSEKDIVDRWMSTWFPERSGGDYSIRPDRGDVPGAVVYRAGLQNRFGDCYQLELPFEHFQRAGGASGLVRRLNEREVGPRMRRLPNGSWVYDRGEELRRLRSSGERTAS